MIGDRRPSWRNMSAASPLIIASTSTSANFSSGWELILRKWTQRTWLIVVSDYSLIVDLRFNRLVIIRLGIFPSRLLKNFISPFSEILEALKNGVSNFLSNSKSNGFVVFSISLDLEKKMRKIPCKKYLVNHVWKFSQVIIVSLSDNIDLVDEFVFSSQFCIS